MTRPRFKPCAVRIVGMIALSLSLPATGCRPDSGTVSGKVTYNRVPLKYGTVTFFCSDGQIISGLIAADGTYSIPHMPPGAAQIAVRTYPPVPEGFQIPQQLPPSKDAPKLAGARGPGGKRAPSDYLRIPEKYSTPEQSGLCVTVTEGDQEYDIHLGP